ncbi:glycosyl hydrolase [Verrucomicrobiaceae bacterium 227]
MMFTRRQFAGLSLAALPDLVLGSEKEASRKKGWAGGSAALHQKFGVHWHYTWSPGGRGAQFVPMVKGKNQINNGAFRKVTQIKNLPYLLGFNEPERAKQGNLSVKDAVKHWRKLQEIAEAKNSRLGSPAPSSDQGGMRWLEAFMKEAKRERLKVDFIAVHYYRSRDPDDLENFIDEVAKTYRLPIWLTEFNGWSGPRDEHEDFLKKALKFLERERKVERYAYFEPGAGKPHSLLNKDGSLTKMGEMYRDAGT